MARTLISDQRLARTESGWVRVLSAQYAHLHPSKSAKRLAGHREEHPVSGEGPLLWVNPRQPTGPSSLAADTHVK